MPDVLIVLHGCHLDAQGWEQMIWGEPADGLYGRAPRALMESQKYQDPLIFWGSGGSSLNGITEADHTFKLACERFAELAQFSEHSPESFRAYLTSVTHMNRTATTTTEEIVAAAKICRQQVISKLVVVSSSTHIARCLQEALIAKADGLLPGVEVYATAADTAYAGYSARDTVVVEPPHRGDMPQVAFHENAKRLFQFLRSEKHAHGLNRDWAALIDKWLVRLPK